MQNIVAIIASIIGSLTSILLVKPNISDITPVATNFTTTSPAPSQIANQPIDIIFDISQRYRELVGKNITVEASLLLNTSNLHLAIYNPNLTIQDPLDLYQRKNGKELPVECRVDKEKYDCSPFKTSGLIRLKGSVRNTPGQPDKSTTAYYFLVTEII